VQVTTTALPGGTSGQQYSAALQASGGSGSYRWSVASGALPAGIALDSASGTLSGTPAAAGQSTCGVRVEDAASASNTDTRELTIDVAPGTAPLAIATTALPYAYRTYSYSTTLEGSGGSGARQWSVASGVLPPGMTLGASTGTISGKSGYSGTWSFTVRLSDATGHTSRALSLVVKSAGSYPGDSDPPATEPEPTVAPLAVATTTLPYAYRTYNYATTIEASGGSGARQWRVSSGSLPPGMTLDASTGTISGKSGYSGTWSFTVDVSDATGSATRALSLVVKAAGSYPGDSTEEAPSVTPLSVTTTTLPYAYRTYNYTTTLEASGGSGARQWRVSSGSLPPGMTLGASTGTISGKSGYSGTWSFTVEVSDSTGPATRALTLTVKSAGSYPG
jgi:hypothetical protein